MLSIWFWTISNGWNYIIPALSKNNLDIWWVCNRLLYVNRHLQKYSIIISVSLLLHISWYEAKKKFSFWKTKQVKNLQNQTLKKLLENSHYIFNILKLSFLYQWHKNNLYVNWHKKGKKVPLIK